MTEPPRNVLGDAAAPYRSVEDRRGVARSRLVGDADCWFVTSHPGHGPYAVPLSFLPEGATVFLFTHPRRPTVRNVLAEPRVLLVFGGYDDAVLAHGTCRVTALGDVRRETLERYVERAGWRPAEPFVALEVALTRVTCSRSPAEDADRGIWAAGMPVFW